MRKADQDECARLGATPLEAVDVSVRASPEAYALVADGAPQILFGHVPSPNLRQGHVWMSATPWIEENAKFFIRWSKPWFNWICRHYDIVSNIVSVENTVAIHWLRSLGCQFMDKVESIGPNKSPFLRFVRTLNQCVSPSQPRLLLPYRVA